MKKDFIHISTVAAGLLIALLLPAREIPKLPSDPAVSAGTLPNGMSYYVAANSSFKGFADFMLVQKTGMKTVPDSLSCHVAAAASLDSLPHFVSSSPDDFLARHGCKPSGGSFVAVSDDATVYSFSDVLLSSGNAVADSMLLMITDIVDRPRVSGNEFLRKWYPPSDQAVIICGDVDPAAIAGKLRMISYMCVAGVSQPRPEYVWEDRPETDFVTCADSTGALAEISMVWRSPRTPVEYMNTVQPAIYEAAVDELALIAHDRIASAMEDRDIPFAGLSCRRSGGLDGPGDEHFSVSVNVARENARGAFEVLASVLSALDAGGASMGEFKEAQARRLWAMSELASLPVKSNSDYAGRCRAAFLYNGSLASEKEKLAFHLSRNVPDTTMLRLFSKISSALLDGSGNLSVYTKGTDFETRPVFDSVWRAGGRCTEIIQQSYSAADTMAFPGYGPKVKIKSVKKDYLSGGEIWTFSNGFKVIYKKMPTGGNMYYSLALSGGYGSISGLGRGEGSFVSDYPELCYIAGLKGRDFKKLMASMDVTMDTEVNLSNTIVSGKAPDHKMQLLMRSLLAFSNERRPDSTAFSYYLRSEKLRLEHAKGGRRCMLATIDSLMCPDYDYSVYKSAANLNPGIAGKADELFSYLSSKMNDGVLVLVGDMDETALKKLISLYAGGFRTKKTAFRRPAVRYQPLSGWLTYTVEGDVPMAVVAMSARLPMTAENYMAAPIAAMALDQALTEAFSGTGVTADVSYACKIYPEERFSVMLTIVPPDGYSLLGVIGTVRSVLAELAEKDMPEELLAAYKEYIRNYFAVEMSGPLYWRNAIVLRYLEGKDFTVGYDSKVGAVDAPKVRGIIASLKEGSKVEYIVKAKDVSRNNYSD